MQSYSVRDVERVLQLSRGTIRSLVGVGFVTPTRGERREYRFSFQDLIVLRAARALIAAKVSRRRIRRSLQDLRRHLPETVPLSGLCIRAVGDRVVVREGESHWQVDDGQYLLGFDVSVDNGVLQVADRTRQSEEAAAKLESAAAAAAATATATAITAAEAKQAEDWFERALELEGTDPRGALRAYERAVAADPQDASAWINWGRLLHEQGQTQEAEHVYRRALDRSGSDPLLMFNLGVLLEDLGRTGSALEAYQNAIGEDPTLADCHYNLARLYESLGKPQHAIRHLGQYRRLVTSDTR